MPSGKEIFYREFYNNRLRSRRARYL